MFCVFTRVSLLLLAALSQTSGSSLSKVSSARRAQSAAGVFLLIEGDKYTFNFTAARTACLVLNVTMATRAQMERAVQLGLETCKFGWTSEQVAVVPRLTSDSRCGSGKTGVVTWNAGISTKFGAFCFNASEETPDRSTASPLISTPAPTALTPTSTPATPPTTKTTTPAPTTTIITTTTTTTTTTEAPKQTSPSLPATPTPRVSSSSSSSTSSTSSTRVPTSLPHHQHHHLITSKPSTPTFTFHAAVHASVSATASSMSSTAPVLGDVPTALIILSIILLLLTAAGLVWYYKLNIFASWSQAQQKDDTETEMWKHTDSEMNLHVNEGEEEEDDDDDDEESDRKYSSDITLCVNPGIKMDSLE